MAATSIAESTTKPAVDQLETGPDALIHDEAFKKRERAVVWKLDCFIAPVMGLLMLISYLDRGNIGFAATQGMSKDIGLVGSQLNVCVSIFYVFYVLAEFPTSLYVKRLSFALVIPIATIGWGIICLGTGFVHSYGSLVACRLLLGVFEGALFPSMTLFIANWYRREELATRIAFLFGASALSGAFGGVIAWGVLHMNGRAGLAGWRWLYIIEGLITIVFGFTCFFLVPKSFERAYFLTEDDRVVMRQRAELTEQYSGGSGHYRLKDVKLAANDIKTWVHALCQFCSVTILYGFGTFLPVIIENGLGYSEAQAQYFTIPVNIWGAIVYFAVAILSDRYQSRFIPLIFSAPIGILGYALLLAPNLASGVHYFATFLIASAVYTLCGGNLAWTAANTAPDAKRSATVGLLLTLTQLSGVVAGQIYQTNSAPNYTLGHAWSLGSLAVAWIGWWLVRDIYKRREQSKAVQGGGQMEEMWDDRAADYHYQF